MDRGKRLLDLDLCTICHHVPFMRARKRACHGMSAAVSTLASSVPSLSEDEGRGGAGTWRGPSALGTVADEGRGGEGTSRGPSALSIGVGALGIGVGLSAFGNVLGIAEDRGRGGGTVREPTGDAWNGEGEECTSELQDEVTTQEDDSRLGELTLPDADDADWGDGGGMFADMDLECAVEFIHGLDNFYRLLLIILSLMTRLQKLTKECKDAAAQDLFRHIVSMNYQEKFDGNNWNVTNHLKRDLEGAVLKFLSTTTAFLSNEDDRRQVLCDVLDLRKGEEECAKKCYDTRANYELVKLRDSKDQCECLQAMTKAQEENMMTLRTFLTHVLKVIDPAHQQDPAHQHGMHVYLNNESRRAIDLFTQKKKIKLQEFSARDAVEAARKKVYEEARDSLIVS